MNSTIFVPNTIKNKGIKLGDEVFLEAFGKGKRKLAFNRTRYQIKSGLNYSIDYQTSSIELPVACNEKFHCEIILTNQNSLEESDQRYLVKWIAGEALRLNGSWVYQAFLEHGDVLEIGMNKFYFKDVLDGPSLINEIPIEVIKSNLAILIEGETGTGKTRLAKIIHQNSLVSGNFVHLNLSSFSSSLVESELFGHAKGAFTGAINEKRGAIAEANRGTLFLDEIDSLSYDLQTKLLIFLESQEYRSVGSERVKEANTRIIFASGQKLSDLVIKNKIRKDFYFRLCSGYGLHMASLRDDRDKIIKVCEEFEADEFVVIADELKRFYREQSWPGNIRQLVSHLKKKKIFAAGKKIIFDEVDYALLDIKVSAGIEKEAIMSLEEVKRQHCLKVFYKFNQNFKVTSKVLNISPNTLRHIVARSAA